MKNFAIVSLENKVTNIIVANSKEDVKILNKEKLIEYTDKNSAIYGGTYNEETNTFLPPVEETE